MFGPHTLNALRSKGTRPIHTKQEATLFSLFPFVQAGRRPKIFREGLDMRGTSDSCHIQNSHILDVAVSSAVHDLACRVGDVIKISLAS